jgi:hypothetical protein
VFDYFFIDCKSLFHHPHHKKINKKKVEIDKLFVIKNIFFSFWKPKSGYLPNENFKDRSPWAKRGEYPGRFCTTLSLDTASKQPHSLKTAHNWGELVFEGAFQFLSSCGFTNYL